MPPYQKSCQPSDYLKFFFLNDTSPKVCLPGLRVVILWFFHFVFFVTFQFFFVVVSAKELWVANPGVTSPRRLLYSALEPTVSSPFMPMQPGQCDLTSFTYNLCMRWSSPILAFVVQHIWKFCTWVIGASLSWSIVKLTKWKAAMFSETPSNNTVYANQ